MRALLRPEILIFILATIGAARSTYAQEPQEPRFAPPRPVVSDPADFEDPAEEDPDFAGGDFPRPVPPIPSQTQPPAPQPPAPAYAGSPGAGFVNDSPPDVGGGGGHMSPGKLHFKVISGVFWHKGMKRTVKHVPEPDYTPDNSSPAAPFNSSPSSQPPYSPPSDLSPDNFSDDPNAF